MDTLSRAEENFVCMMAKKLMAVRMLGGKCSICGEDRIFSLDFHHSDMDGKEFGISPMVRSQKRWSEIKKEVEKCQLLCANCHTQHHRPDKGRSSVIKDKILQLLNISDCPRCGRKISNISVLEFHHRDKSDKKFTLGNVFARKVSVSFADVLEEIAKCDVMCRNCHRIKLADEARYNRLSDVVENKVKKYRESRKVNGETAIALRKEGRTFSAIGRIMGHSKSTIFYALKVRGVN